MPRRAGSNAARVRSSATHKNAVAAPAQQNLPLPEPGSSISREGYAGARLVKNAPGVTLSEGLLSDGGHLRRGVCSGGASLGEILLGDPLGKCSHSHAEWFGARAVLVRMIGARDREIAKLRKKLRWLEK